MNDTVPAILPTQFESESVGKLSQSVNMFRGSVNVTKTLVNLPGKPGDSTLSVSLAMVSDSDVSQQALQWNLAAPTGTLGLGWSIARSRITAQTSGALSPYALSYSLEYSNTSTALIEDDQPWLRVTLDAAAAATLAAGTVNPAVVQAFAAQSVALDPSATLAADGEKWTLTDDIGEHVFSIQPGASGADVYDGGVSYQAQNYQFWHIQYYRPFERWEITTDSGEVRVFGGGVTTVGDIYASTGNSIEWAVGWTNAGSNWSGPSQDTDGQFQYAAAWNLCTRLDRWGSQVSYGYNEFPRSGGLLGNNAEQAVGSGGLAYTKACYPTSIVDVFGRTVTLAYGNKSFTADVQEYADPHVALTPADQPETPPVDLGLPGPYQDCYETLYLQQITVDSADGDQLYSLAFEYPIVQAVSALTVSLQVTAAKRYLGSVTETNPHGQSLGGFTYTYSLDGPNYGALASVTYPQGAVGTWTYTAGLELDICDRTQTVNAPAAVGQDATPFVWIGEDYVVAVWTSADGSVTTLDAYTWNGQWVDWSAGTLPTTGALQIQPGPLGVVNEEAFALALPVAPASAQQTDVFLVARNPNQPTEWMPPQLVTVTGTVTSFVAGTSFVVATADEADGTSALYCWTWSWQQGTWLGTGGAASTTSDALVAFAGDEYYLTVTTSTSAGTTELALAAVDPSGQWHAGGTQVFDYTSDANPDHAVIGATGPSCAAFCFAQNENDAVAQLVRWDDQYDFIAPQEFSIEREKPDLKNGELWPPVPQVADNSTIGVRQYLFRFDAGAWQDGSFEAQGYETGWLGFAYTDDAAVQVYNDSEPAGTVLAYDPTVPGYVSTPVTATPPQGDASKLGWPVAGTDFIVACNTLYCRGSSTDWASAVAAGVFDLPGEIDGQTVDSTALADGIPQYLAYVAPGSDPDDDAVQLLVLQNGGVLPPPSPLATTTFTSPLDAAASQAPVGPSTIVTYPADAFDFGQAQSYTMYRYAGQAMSGPIVDYPVSGLTVDDGFGGTYQTAYEFSAASASCDPTGQTVKYYRSASYRGAASVGTSTFGRTVYSYQNGVQPGMAYSMVDGLLAQTADFAGACAFTTQFDTDFGLTSSASGPIPAALLAAWPHGVPAPSASATMDYTVLDGNYAYWAVVDPTDGSTWNVDYDGDPSDPAGVRVFTGTAVKSTTSTWTVFTRRNPSPTTPDSSPPLLHGGYARPAASIGRRDDVPLTTQFSYIPAGFTAPFHGGVVSRSWSFPDGTGAPEAHQRESTYGCEVDDALWYANLLTPVLATRHTVAVGGAGTVTVESTATTWSGWTQQGGNQLTIEAPAQNWSWIGDPGGSDSGIFPFGQTPDPTLWRLRSTVTSMRDDGLTAESVDASGTVQATLYDTAGQVPCAMATNASFVGGQAAFTSFEAYEDLSAWTLGGGAATNADCGYAAAQSLSLPAGATASIVLSPDPTRIVFFSAWCTTPPEWSVTDDAGWTLTVSVGGVSVGSPVVLPFAATNGVWAYQSVPVDLPAMVAPDAQDVTLTVAAANGATDTVLVDEVTTLPLATRFAARTYDPVYRLSLANLDGTGKTWRTVRDATQRRVGGTNADTTPASLQLSYLSTSGNPGGFAAADPNASLAVRALGAGTYQTFRDGTQWTTDWLPSDPSAFAAAGGVLVHASTTDSATLTSVATPTTGAMAWYCELASLDSSPLSLGADLSVAIGDDSAFTLSASSGQWTATINGSAVESLATFVGPPRWLLVLQVGGYVTFHGNGQLLFSQQATVDGAVALTTGANALGISNLTLFDEPTLMVKYSDATGVSWQSQALTAESYLVTQSIRDGCAQTVVKTKPTPGTFGGGATLPVPAYRSTLVSGIAAFVAGLGGAATMQGDVDDWYGGEHDTDDQGYPYQRIVHEPARTARPLEVGFAGLASAIVDYATTSPADRPTVQYTYGANGTGDVPWLDLPAGSYQLRGRSSPSKVVQTSVSDATKNRVARFSALGSAEVLSGTTATYGNGTATITVEEPDGYEAGEGALAYTQTTNGLGQTSQASSPDSGQTAFLYDVGGRLRFAQDPVGAADGSASYFTWDSLGRRLSRGILAWTEPFDQLSTYADDPAWPEDQSIVAYTQQKAYAWDGDGTDPNAVGMLTQQSAVTGATATTVTEAFTWNGRGLPMQRVDTIATGETDLGTFTIAYAYDGADRMTSLTYPAVEGIGFTSAVYGYDGHDRVVSISDQSGGSFATYTYSPAGQLAGATYGSGGIPATLTHDSAGRLLGTAVAAGTTQFSSALTYTADSAVQTLVESLVMGVTTYYTADVTYTYDVLGRLIGADDAETARTLGISFVAPGGNTDLNGNVQTITDGAGTVTTLAYGSSSNQAASVQYGDGDVLDYSYDPNGNVSAVGEGGATFAYLPASTLPQTATNDGTTVNLAYDASGRRVVKKVGTDQPQLLVNGGASGPLVTVDASGAATAWVYAPQGIIAMCGAGARYSVVNDYLCSPRAVLDDEAAVVAAYAQDAIGNTVTRSEPSPGFVPFGFTGYEFDAELGLYNAGARLYDPTTGRFLAPDPVAQFPSAYSYAGNVPTMFVDPTGRMTEAGEIAIDTVLAVVFLASVVATSGATASLLPAEMAALSASTLLQVAAVGAIGGAVSGAAFEGIEYTVATPPGQWKTGQFFEVMGAAALAGAAGGALGSVAAPALGAAWDAGESALSGLLGDTGESIASASDTVPPTELPDPQSDGVPEREPAPAPAQASGDGDGDARSNAKSRSWQGSLARSVTRNAVAYGASGAVRGVIENPLVNLIEGHPASSGLGWDVLEGVLFGVVQGAGVGAATTLMELNPIGIDRATVVGWWDEAPFEFAAAVASGGAVVIGSIAAGFIGLTPLVRPYLQS